MGKVVQDTFCILPWIHLNVMPDSTVLPCCISPYEDIYGNGATETFSEIANSEKFKELRKSMLANLPSSGCKRCYQLEDAGFQSMRMQMNHFFKDYLPLKDQTAADGSIKNMPLKYVDVRFSNLCNFKCRGCGPDLSSSWFEDHQVVYNYQNNRNKVNRISTIAPEFWNELKQLIPDADIVYFGGGEPLITKEHFEILQLLVEKKKFNVVLRYNTNLSQLHYGDHNLSAIWSRFDSVSLSISIDDIGPRAEYFRHGTNWAVVERNFKTLMEFHPKVERNINCTVNIMNVYYLPEIIKYVLENGFVAPENFHVNLLLDPVEYRIDVMPVELKKRVTNKLTKLRFYFLSLDHTYLKLARDIENILKFLNEQDLSAHLALFQESTARLDGLRHENFTKTFPELAELGLAAECK